MADMFMDRSLLATLYLLCLGVSTGFILNGGQKCTFELDWCSYRNVPGYPISWARYQMTESDPGGTRPDTNHSIHVSDWVLNLESSGHPGDMAALTTGTQYFPYNQVFSVNLQYRTGHNPMSLTVNITGSSRGDWAHSFTDTDKNWTSICLDAIVKGPIDVTFIGGVAGNGRSYLALDDVTISYGRSCIGSTTLETPNNVSCSFETEDSCGYTNYDGENDFGFSRKQSWTISNNTGTTVDRNGLGRSYMAAVALTSQIEKAKLYSPSFSSTKNQQRVTFWYNINGEGPQTLKVYFTVQWVQGIPSFRKTKDSLIPAWEKGCVDVTASSNLASVVFEATVASGIVAVDDVSLEDGACATLTS